MIAPIFSSCTKGDKIETPSGATTSEAVTTEKETETSTEKREETSTEGTASTEETTGSDTSETETQTGNNQTETETETETETDTETTPVIESNNNKDAYYIIEAVAEYGRNGLANGWKYDNRFDLTNATGTDATMIHDRANDKFYRFIRDFEAENDGVLKLEMIITAASSNEGVYIGMYDKDENCLFGLTPKDGIWHFFGENEISTGIAISEDDAGKFSIEMEIDLDNNKASLTMNNTYCGEITIKDGAIERLTLGTTKKGTGTLGFKYVRLMKNYPVVDRFIQGDSSTKNQAPANWKVEGDFKLNYIESMRLYDMYSVHALSTAGSTSTAIRNFRAVSGHVSFETMILLPKKTDGASVSLMSGGREIITFVTRDGGKIYVGDQMVHDYIPNVWQTLHVEAYTDKGTADIYINGKKRATVSIDATSFDGIKVGFAPTADAEMWFDDVEIYEIIEHADYPSYPDVAPSDDYNIGMNVCWLWRDQQSGEGWDATSPFREFDPYLGFYDEGLRETADWELKWMAEHGIDFVHACWYAPSADTKAPIKEMRHSYAALHDGYMMAKYSDLVDFCIMWENNSQDVSSFEQFQEYIWNYWVEYYFTDERYARLDNKAVLTIWSVDKLRSAFGGDDQALKAIKWMNKEIQKYGYDGMIILCSAQGVITEGTYKFLKNLGYAGTYAYHWGANGYDPILQNNNNATNLQNASGILHHIPTVSMGFNDVGRNESRSPIISVEDHLNVCQNIKTLLSGLDTGTWKDNTLFISTWNEFSEGTYLFPTESTGFDYLENIRLTFTNDNSEHKDAMPTENQIDRITHLYPPNHAPLRWYEFEAAEPESDFKIYVNGQKLNFTFAPIALENGDYAVVGEARKRGFYSLMRLYYEWDRFTGDGVLTLHTYKERTLVFTVGSDIMLLNGKQVKLEAPFALRDGLPVFHIKELCKYLGYNVTESAAGLLIQAASDDEYNELMSSVADQWEFSIPGEEQGWKGQNSKIETTEDGYLLISPTGDDVAIIHSTNFHSSAYTVVKIGVKYDPNIVKQSAALFFTTTTQTSFDGGYAISAPYQIEGKGEGDTVEAIFILRNNLNFNGKITQIRIDPYTGKDFECYVDYVRCEYLEEYTFESDLVDTEDENQWYFDTDNDTEGWELTNSDSLGVTGGMITGAATNDDPYISRRVNFSAKKYHILCIGMKYFEGIEKAGAKFYFLTSDSSSWSESKAIKGIVVVPPDVREGDTVKIYFDLTKCSGWSGNITTLRFDPFGTTGEYSVDYIRLYKKYSLSGTPLVSITDPENIPEGYTVGTADTAEILIVNDPKDSNNKVFMVNCTTNAANKYTYFMLQMPFEAGKTYIISYKIMPLTDKNGKKFSNTIIGGNLRYGTDENIIKDHTFDGGTNKSSGENWIEVFTSITVSPSYVPNDGKDCFQIWGKHTSEGVGINYLVKDIEIAIK